TQPTFFMQLFGFNGVPVNARSVAGLVSSPSCVYASDLIRAQVARCPQAGRLRSPPTVALT
ncbi:MAG: hypothetical protein M3Z23_05090, partial [Acidobacteriota bacterium]|nr:hypothetical protein [Acidobacteriota bacterium]